MDFAKLGKILKQARVDSGRTQAEIANLLGVTYQNVSSWERGKSKIDIESYVQLCALYGIDTIKPLEESTGSMLIYSLIPTSDTNTVENTLTQDEKELIENYRNLNEQGQEYIKQTMYMATHTYKKMPDLSDLENQA